MAELVIHFLESMQVENNERELVLRAQIGSELPIEDDLQRWFPLWGIPI